MMAGINDGGHYVMTAGTYARQAYALLAEGLQATTGRHTFYQLFT